MKLSKRGEYGLRTLIKLGMAHEVGRDLVSASELAQLERLPLKFVEQILADLRQEGIVGTKRGKYGGYFLETPPSEIKIGRVIRLLDGMLAPIPCASEAFYQPCTCEDEAHCGLRMLMIDVRNAVANILDRYSLAQVVEVTLRKLRRDNLPIPFVEPSSVDPTGLPPKQPPEKRHADPAEGFLALLTEGHESR
ncbi:MAG: Rrf2 family transcriptional regulator [Verrucomicrobiales bacterium]|nr:Rrf2 family transcriptional regulator [Verrucomicrobiales bacterium]